MRRRWVTWAWALGLGLVGSALDAKWAEAQVGPFGSTPTTTAAAPASSAAAGTTASGTNMPFPGPMGGVMGGPMNPYLNPYANPYMNPFMNPGMMGMSPNSGRNLGLYYLNAQAQTGGIGSGRLSGSRGSAARAAAKPKAPRDEPLAEANTPGGSASRYFGRTTPNAGASKYFSRQVKH